MNTEKLDSPLTQSSLLLQNFYDTKNEKKPDKQDLQWTNEASESVQSCIKDLVTQLSPELAANSFDFQSIVEKSFYRFIEEICSTSNINDFQGLLETITKSEIKTFKGNFKSKNDEQGLKKTVINNTNIPNLEVKSAIQEGNSETVFETLRSGKVKSDLELENFGKTMLKLQYLMRSTIEPRLVSEEKQYIQTEHIVLQSTVRFYCHYLTNSSVDDLAYTVNHIPSQVITQQLQNCNWDPKPISQQENYDYIFNCIRSKRHPTPENSFPWLYDSFQVMVTSFHRNVLWKKPSLDSESKNRIVGVALTNLVLHCLSSEPRRNFEILIDRITESLLET